MTRNVTNRKQVAEIGLGISSCDFFLDFFKVRDMYSLHALLINNLNICLTFGVEDYD